MRKSGMAKGGSASVVADVSRIAATLLEMHAAFKLYHWATRRYARHVAADELIDSIVEHGDRMMEALVAATGTVPDRQLRATQDADAGFASDPDAWACAALDVYVNYWTHGEGSVIVSARGDSSICSVRDDLVLALRKATYLFRMA
jgi:hypothetical protein